jgi:DNA-directed RNA polymerase subunit RPC12/RpoP
MSIIKKGKIAESIVVVSFSYICNKCGEILTVENMVDENNKCKKCSEGIMILSHAESDIKK